MEESIRKHLEAMGFEKSYPYEREPLERLPALSSAVTVNTKYYCDCIYGLTTKKFS